MDQYVFLIAASHQLFQVDEAIKKFKIRPSDLTLLIEDMGDEELIKQATSNSEFGEVLAFNNWVVKDVLTNPNKHKAYTNYCNSIKVKAKQISFFASHYDSDNTLLFLSIVKPREFYLMDEGTASFTVSEMRSKKDSRVFQFFIKSALYLQKISLPKQITYFTKYNFKKLAIDKTEFYKQDLIANPLEDLMIDECIFLGTSISEVKLITEDNYLMLMQKVSLLNAGKKIYYYPHRKESAEKLEKIKSLGFIMVKQDQPFELAFRNFTKCPATICSFFCTTVLDNISTTNTLLPELVIYTFDINLLLFDQNVYQNIANHLKTNVHLKSLEI